MDVRVDLWARKPTGLMQGAWGGTIVVDPLLTAALGEGMATIVLPDGRRGGVLVKHAGAGGRGVLKGAGSPPE